MSKQKREKLTATTPEKPLPQKLFIQVEGELTEEKLEAIADYSWFIVNGSCFMVCLKSTVNSQQSTVNN